MPRTRATKTTTTETADSTESKTPLANQLKSTRDNPSKMFILPSKASEGARIVTLPNPRHSRPSRYLVCPETGVYEFTKVAAPKTTPRSWMVETVSDKADQADSAGHVTTAADLFVATTLDPIFLILPALAGSNDSRKGADQKRLYLSSYDYFDKLQADGSHLSEIMSWDFIRTLLESRMAVICDTVDVGGEQMFRLSDEKLLAALLEKARRILDPSLPPSLEERFVSKALEAPVVQSQLPAKDDSLNPNDAETTTSTPKTDSDVSQPSTNGDSATSSFSNASTAATSVMDGSDNFVSAMEASEEVVGLQRLRVAFNFICSSYVAPSLASQLQTSLANHELSHINFAPLDEYLSKVAQVKAEIFASRSTSDYSRKRMRNEEEEEARAEKKRKAEEEKKKKASESRGVRELKKVNTSGMKKMSDFFKKK